MTAQNPLPTGLGRPGPLGRLGRRLRRRETLADLALWAFMSYPLPTLHEVPLWLRAVAVPLLALATWLSRRAPLAATAIPAALGLAATPELFTSTFTPALAALSFLLGRRTQDVRRSLAAAGLLCAVGLVLALTLPGADLWNWFTLVTTVLFAAVLPWLLGRFRRQQYELQGAGWELAARMEREQQLVAERARLRERSRIAGDMHDSLGHDLSLLAVRAAALQVAPGMDDAARASAAELRQAAADATERLRQIIGLLRQETTATTAETVPDLVARTAASGVRITLHQHDADDAPTAPPPPLVAHAVHRVVQEAVTNATKHAPGAAITVELNRQRDAMDVTVRDTGPDPAADRTTGPGSGTGLISLDERVRLAGGTFRARRTDDGFEVTAHLPFAAAPLPAAPAPPDTATSRSREHLARARRRVRRGIANAIWIPAAATAVLAVLMYGFQLYTSHRSVLPERTYEQLRTGDPATDVLPRLPAYEFDDGRPDGAPPDPPGVDRCRFYRTATFDNSPLYRLCFTDGRLTHKALLPMDERGR
ncbi:sensor histidine kinase [Streptomyces albus]|uniref:sensor histidine kinase n=2 Tax=Streptomyces albus TaxID=1888 RepID=UPI003406F1BD